MRRWFEIPVFACSPLNYTLTFSLDQRYLQRRHLSRLGELLDIEEFRGQCEFDSNA